MKLILPTDDLETQKINMMITKLRDASESVLHSVYSESLLKQLANLYQNKETARKREFNPETMLFITDLCTDIANKSALDFVTHAPTSLNLNIFCVAISQAGIEHVTMVAEKCRKRVVVHALLVSEEVSWELGVNG